MKRNIDSTDLNCILKNEDEPNTKVMLVEREEHPSGVPLVNSSAIAKKSYVDSMELSESVSNVSCALQTNARNKLDMIGRQMMNLHELMSEVFEETKLGTELHNVACNFVKKPGHVYHLYERPSGQKYLGMLSPEEWQNIPHKYLGSFKLEADLSWTPTKSNHGRYEGVNFLKQIFGISQGPALS